MNVDVTVALIAAGAGIVVALVGAAVGAWLTARSEHRRWLRDQRLETYTDVVDFATTVAFADDPDVSALLDRARTTGARLELLAPDDTYKAGQEYLKAAMTGAAAATDKDAKKKAELQQQERRTDFTSKAHGDLRSKRR